MTDLEASGKWDAIYAAGDHGSKSAAAVLVENTHLLPDTGRALDLASGLGANALILAANGLETWAWDISTRAIERLLERCRDTGLSVHGEVRDVSSNPPGPASFDVIVVSRFLDRQLMPTLVAALNPGGLIFYQTFTREAVDDSGPKNPDYRLAKNELLRYFESLQLLYYREEGRTGDIGRGHRNEAMLVASKPAW
ncbi:MAG: methyltransferase domain-containing protein [Proteobacteria bacterium]|nr:methyltransferase domain-containing protein [Pseudomonadota bacterium]